VAPRLFLDSADLRAWSEFWPLGLFQGITTNPTLLGRAGYPCTPDALAELASASWRLGCEELHLQAWGSCRDELLSCSQALLALDPVKIVVKLPLTQLGLEVAKHLLDGGHRVTMTACYSPSQAIAAAALGATYVAPYLGRISDGGQDGRTEVITMHRCLRGVNSSTRLLVASLRQVEDLPPLACEGITTFTLSPSLASQLWTNLASEKAAAQFEADALGGRQ
jgi:transaldolase